MQPGGFQCPGDGESEFLIVSDKEIPTFCRGISGDCYNVGSGGGNN